MMERYSFLSEELLKPEVYSDYNKMKTISKEKQSLEETVNTYKHLLTIDEDIEAAK